MSPTCYFYLACVPNKNSLNVNANYTKVIGTETFLQPWACWILDKITSILAFKLFDTGHWL